MKKNLIFLIILFMVVVFVSRKSFGNENENEKVEIDFDQHEDEINDETKTNGESKSDEQIIKEHFIQQSSSSSSLDGLNDGPIRLEIVGDTSHLFTDDDFKKEEAPAPLYDDFNLLNQTNTNESISGYESSNNESLDQLALFTSTETIVRDKESIASMISMIKKNSTKSNSHPECSRPNETNFRTNNSVQVVNGSRLSSHIAESKDNDCFLVLFYVPWCPFSARLAPIYNALPRAFLNFDILAFDVSKSIGYNTKFGTSAVPMILLFQHRSILAKFNYTQKNLSDYIDFVANLTGYEPNKTIGIEVQDFEGPVPTVAVKRFDYYLLISWLFVIFVSVDFTIRKSQLKRYLIRFIRNLLANNRLLQLPQPPQRPMIQNLQNEPVDPHPHPHYE